MHYAFHNPSSYILGPDLINKLFAQGRGKVEASLSGALLTGTVQTDFKAIWAKIIQEIPEDAMADLNFKFDDLTVKVGMI